MTLPIKTQSRNLPKGFKIYPEKDGARFETPTTFGWCKSTQLCLEEIEREISTGEPAWRIPFTINKRALKAR